jgi:hypothetical protein
MMTNLFNNAAMLAEVNGHKVPIVDGVAWVLNADVAAAEAFGWTVLSNQPPVLEPTLMRPPPIFLIGYGGGRGILETQFPDGSPINLQDAPGRHIVIQAAPDQPELTRKSVDEQNCEVPAQWVAWAKAAWGWMHAPSPSI